MLCCLTLLYTLLETPACRGVILVVGTEEWALALNSDQPHFFSLVTSFYSFFFFPFILFPLSFLEYYPEIVVFPFFFRLFTSVIERDLFDILRLVCSGGIALILSLTGVIGIWWWVGYRTQPLLFGLLILPAWDIIDPAVSDRKWIDCGPLTLHIGCFYPNDHCAHCSSSSSCSSKLCCHFIGSINLLKPEPAFTWLMIML